MATQHKKVFWHKCVESKEQCISTTLNLYVQVFIKSFAVKHEVWSQRGNDGNSWRRGEVFIGIRHNIQVREV